MEDLSDDLLEIFDQDINNEDHVFDDNKSNSINDLLALSSLMSHHINSDDFLSSESRLVRSKSKRLFHFLITDIYNEPMTQALGDRISNLAEVDDALINLNRNATLKFRNYKQFREQVRSSTSQNIVLLNYLTFSYWYRLMNDEIHMEIRIIDGQPSDYRLVVQMSNMIYRFDREVH